MKRVLLKSILAGLMISIGTIAYLRTDPLFEAFLFSIGLLSIFEFEFYLFTGLVPYITKLKELPFILTVLCGNIVGCSLMFLFPSNHSKEIIQQKVSEEWWMILLSAMLCNILICVAVEAFKKQRIITVILSVATFVICGFNHSIANICFVVSARMFTWDTLVFILISLLGNAVGGICFRKLIEYENSKDRKKLHS